MDASPDEPGTVVLTPGTALVLGFKRDLTQAEAEGIKQRFASRVPGVPVVIVASVDFMAVVEADV